MADLVQTPANVAIGGTVTRLEAVVVGEAVTQGMPGYLNLDDGMWYKAANTSEALSKAACIFMTPQSTVGGLAGCIRGDGLLVNLGATLVVGKQYVVSGLGAIIERSELISGKWIAFLGTATTTAFLKTKFDPTSVQVP